MKDPADRVNPGMHVMAAWKVVLSMVHFKAWNILVDFFSILIIRLMGQVAPGLILQAFFNLLTGSAPTGFNIWTVAALSFGAFLGRILGAYGFVYADVPLFAEASTLIRKNILTHPQEESPCCCSQGPRRCPILRVRR